MREFPAKLHKVRHRFQGKNELGKEEGVKCTLQSKYLFKRACCAFIKNATRRELTG